MIDAPTFGIDVISAMPYDIDGCLYVAEFAGGIVKIGRTNALAQRLSNLRSVGHVNGRALIRWVAVHSLGRQAIYKMEREILEDYSKMFDPMPEKHEWFADASMAAAVSVMLEHSNASALVDSQTMSKFIERRADANAKMREQTIARMKLRKLHARFMRRKQRGTK